MLDAQTGCEVNEDHDEIKGAPFFPFFVNDWRSGTADLTDEQKGFYIDLLVLMWDRRGGLTTDVAELAQLMRRDRRKVRRLLDELMGLASFGRPAKKLTKPKLRIVDGKLVNGRMMETILRHQKRSELQAQAARRPRKIAETSQQSRSEVAAKSQQTPAPDPVKSMTCASHLYPDPDPEEDKKEERPVGLLSSTGDDAPAPEPKPKRSKPKIEVDALAAFNAYNDTALRIAIPQAGALTPGRRTKIATRIREHGGGDAWARALAAIERSSFLRGRNDRGWRASLDFMLSPTNFAKLMDGGYDDRAPKASSRAMEWMAKRYGQEAART